MTDPASPTHALSWSTLVGSIRKYAIFTLDADGTIDSWNLGVRELLGYERHEFVGQRAEVLFTPEDRAEDAPARELAHARDRGEAQDDRWHLRKDGSRIWINGHVSGFRDAHGEVLGFLKIMRDRTQAREAEQRLRESEERFAKSFGRNPNPIAILQLPNGRIREANAAFANLFRHRSTTLTGSLGDFGVRLEPGRFQHIVELLERHGSAREDATFRRADGSIGHGAFAFERIELGGEPHAVMLLHDVTNWKEAQEEIERERRFVEATLSSLPGIFYMLDDARCVRWNQELERVTGYGPDELDGMHATHLLAEGEQVLASIDEALTRGRATVEGHLRSKDGGLTPYLFTGQRLDLSGDTFVVGVGLDVTAQHRAHEVLERRARQQAAIAELGATGVGTVDLQELLDRAVELIAETLPVEHVHVLELDVEQERLNLRASSGTLDPKRLAERFDEQDHLVGRLLSPPEEARDYDPVLSEVRPHDDEVLRRHGIQSGLRAAIRGRGRIFGMVEALSGHHHVFREDDERFLRAVGYLLMGSIEHIRLHDELAHRAEHDSLTGLPNRRLFESRLEGALQRASRGDSRVAVLFLDLDRFKNVNDALGHQAGDELLKTVARRLRDAVRSWDVVARMGGDEFVLALPDVSDESEVVHVSERILEAFDVPFAAAGRELVVGTTIGISLYPDDGRDATALLRAADAALYEGKARGRNAFRFFAAERNASASERLELENDLRQALVRNEFELRYQPRVEISGERVTAVEALLRWRHPKRGHLHPPTFLSVADSTGSVVPIGEWTMAEAFRHYAEWKRRTPSPSPPRLALNVAGPHFLQPSFPSVLERIAGESGVSLHDVELEITETTLLSDLELVTGHLDALHALGVAMTIDDFGTGYASLGHLRTLPIDAIKIDETFIHRLDATEDAQNDGFVEVISLLGSNLGKTVVAEGVETPRQLQRVRELGCDQAQGHLISRPLDPDDLLEYLRERSA